VAKLWTEKEIEEELREIGRIAGSKPQALQQDKPAVLTVNNVSFGRVLVQWQYNNGASGQAQGNEIGEVLEKARYAVEMY
jgi:hypothetical protein